MKQEITVLFTDTHFGVKNNSMTWLKSQMNFIYNQLIPYLKEKKKDHLIRLIHLGDVFDSRSSISTMVASKVVEVFGELRNCVDSFYIIAGNHDFYSPNSDEVNTLSLLFDQMDIKLIIDKIYQDGGDIMVPWYSWGAPEIQNMINGGSKRIFTHTDIVTKRIPYQRVDVFSGHEHVPMIKKKKGLFNLGSCYSLDFTDANQKRGFWVLIDNELRFEANTQSICFWRLYNEEIFDEQFVGKINNWDYIEIYITQKNMSNEKYIRTINSLTKKYKNIWIIPKSDDIDTEIEKFEGYNIEDITKSLIPNELKEKFQVLLNKIQKNIIIDT